MKEKKGEEKRGVSESDYMKTTAVGGAAFGHKSAFPKPSKANSAIIKHIIRLTVNGVPHELEIGNRLGDIAPWHTLAFTLRETLGLTGTKIACDHGACGACTVIMDRKPVLSCMTLTVECDGKNITTIEGLGDPITGKLDPLQQAFIDHTAFQCGFCTPGILMSAKALLNGNSSPTEKELKEALAGNYCRCISHYHVLGAIMAVGKEREVKGTSEKYRFIGKATPRKDAVEIVTGKVEFIDDIKQPNLLYGKVLRSRYPHANIKNIDTSKAEKLPGVMAVLTYKNTPNWKAGLPPHVRVLDSKVRFVGDAVALVAAKTEEIAKEALELIDVEYEPLSAVYDVEEATKPQAPQLYTEFPGNILPPGCPLYGPKALQEIVFGDIEKGFKEADFITEGTYMYENIPNPLPIEPPGVIVKWEESNKLTVWSATQTPNLVKLTAQLSMGESLEVRSIGTACGGSYGTKTNYWQLVLPAAALAKVTGRPVKLCFTKEEHLAAFTLRLGSRIHGKVGIKKDGTVTAMSGDWLINTGAFSDLTQAQVAVACGEAQLMLRCSNWSLKPKVVCTNRNPSGIVRGFGGQELKCAFIPILTMAVEKAGLDPVEFFKKNFVKSGDGYYWRDGNWWVYRGIDFSKAMEKGAEVFGWKDKWKGWGISTAVNGIKRRGVGVGVHGNADVGEDVSEAYVQLNPDVTAVVHICISEHGTGQRSNLCKMVAEVLKLPLERVSLTPPDTLVNPFEFGPVGSRGTYALGSAVIAAAEEARRKLFEKAAPLLEANPEDLETQDGEVYVRGAHGEKKYGIPWIAVMNIFSTCMGFGRYEPDFSISNFMMVFVEVEVDVETGKVELLGVVNATDVGQIIDPPSLENQLYGGLGAAGLDSALIEESVLDKAIGRIMNCNMVDYKWRTFLELPTIQNVILETPFPTHRFKAVGVGEITPAPGPCAILMAVSNAIGKKVHEYPITPDKVLRALGKIK